MRGLIPATWAATATLAAPALRLSLRRREARGKEIAARLPERRGIDATPRPAGRLLWLHAASVGETVSILPVLAALPANVAVLLTTGSVTSARLLEQRLPALGLAPRVFHRFVPLDVPAWVGRFLDHWRPDAAGFVESELWPNLIAAAARRHIPLALLNARLSPRSYAYWQRAPGFARQLLGAFDIALGQSEEDAARLRALGATRTEYLGNLKFAAAPLPADQAELARLGALVASRPVWLAANTHTGEEVIAADVHRRLAPAYPELLTIVAPRHPERGQEISALLDGAPRRSGGEDPGSDFWIADTLGELGLAYRLAPVVFMGGSLTPRGGQNPLEAARLGCALAMGSDRANQSAAVAALEEAGALATVTDAAALAAWVHAMLCDPGRRQAMGEAARNATQRHAELPARIAARLVQLLDRRH